MSTYFLLQIRKKHPFFYKKTLNSHKIRKDPLEKNQIKKHAPIFILSPKTMYFEGT